MPAHCFVAGCKTGYSSTVKKYKEAGLRNPSVFSAPRDYQLLELWRKAIPRKDKVFRSSYKVCELHFPEECIEWTYTKILSDGSVHVSERPYPCLKPGSIPSIFHDLPRYRLTKVPKRQVGIPCPCSTEDQNSLQDASSYSCVANEQQKSIYERLLCCLKNIEKPSLFWTVDYTDEYILCAKWNSQFSCDRRIIICQNLKAKIFLKKIEIPFNFEVGGSDSLTFLLYHVDGLRICENAGSGESVGCRGYICSTEDQSVCSICRIFQERQ